MALMNLCITTATHDTTTITTQSFALLILHNTEGINMKLVRNKNSTFCSITESCKLQEITEFREYIHLLDG